MKRTGINRQRLELMGKPHIGAHYEREDYRTNKLDDGARCAFCGRPATDSHHVVPRSTVHAYTVDTPLGRFVTMSPLFALCRECHDDIHSRRRYAIEWVWEAEQYREEWENGHTLAHICPPASSFLFQQGHYLLTDNFTGTERELKPRIRWEKL